MAAIGASATMVANVRDRNASSRPVARRLLHAAGAADRQPGDGIEVGVDRLERTAGIEQRDRRLAANAGNAGDAIDRVAGEPEEVDDERRRHAHPRDDACRVVALTLVDVEERHAVGDELGQVLVGGEQDGAMAGCHVRRRQRRHQVFRLVAVDDEWHGAEGPHQLPSVGELGLERRGRCRPGLLVLGVLVVAKAGGQAGVEADGEMRDLLAFDHLHQEAQKAVERLHRPSVAIADRVGQGEVRAEEVRAGVDQMERRRRHRAVARQCPKGRSENFSSQLRKVRKSTARPLASWRR